VVSSAIDSRAKKKKTKKPAEICGKRRNSRKENSFATGRDPETRGGCQFGRGQSNSVAANLNGNCNSLSPKKKMLNQEKRALRDARIWGGVRRTEIHKREAGDQKPEKTPKMCLENSKVKRQRNEMGKTTKASPKNREKKKILAKR